MLTPHPSVLRPDLELWVLPPELRDLPAQEGTLPSEGEIRELIEKTGKLSSSALRILVTENERSFVSSPDSHGRLDTLRTAFAQCLKKFGTVLQQVQGPRVSVQNGLHTGWRPLVDHPDLVCKVRSKYALDRGPGRVSGGTHFAVQSEWLVPEEVRRGGVYNISVAPNLSGAPNLLQNILKPKSKPAESLGFLYGGMRGAASLHQRGWVHRDFKPNNILIWKGEGHLSDFELAERMGTNVLNPPGTSFFGDSRLGWTDPLQDVHAAGVSLILCGLTRAGQIPEVSVSRKLGLSFTQIAEELASAGVLYKRIPKLVEAMTGPDLARRPSMAEAAEQVAKLL